MADQLIGSLANNHRKVQIVGEAENESGVSKRLNSCKARPIKQPKLLPNPLLCQLRRRPAQLNLSKSIAPASASPTSAITKPPKIMSVRDKLLQGISMDLGRLQQNPAAFDGLFPPQQAATATKRSSKHAYQSTEKLLDKLHAGSNTDLDDEEEEARRFESKMRSVRKHSQRLQVALQLYTCNQLPFEKLPESSLYSQRKRRHGAKTASRTPSSLSREL